MAERRKRKQSQQQQQQQQQSRSHMSNPGPQQQQGRRGTVEAGPSRLVEGAPRAEAEPNLRVLCEVLTTMSRTPAGKRMNVNPLLRKIGEVVDTDRVYIFRLRSDEKTNRRLVTQIHEWVNSNISPQIDNPEMTDAPYDELPADALEKLDDGESVAFYRDDVKGFAREQMDKQDIQTMLFAPIIVEDGLWGFAGFDHCREKRHWTTIDVDTLMAFAGALGIAATCNQL